MRKIDNDIIHENLLKNKPILAFDDNANYKEWKERLRQKYIELLGIDNIAKNACEIKIEIEETFETDEYTRIRYVFESEKGCPVPCYLLIPKTEQKKIPDLHMSSRSYYGISYFNRKEKVRRGRYYA